MRQSYFAALTIGLGLAAATPALAQTPVFVRWPFTVNANDTTAQRSANTTVNPVVLRRLVRADNSTSVTIGSAMLNVKPYSSAFGMAFAPLAAGGNWGTANGGPGGTVKRTIGTQISVTAPAGSTGLRADSLILTSGFTSTSSSTNLAVVYSKSGFATDSAEATATKGYGNVGSFTAPVAIPQISALPYTTTFRVALNGATGVTLTAGQTLTVRMYFSCSSSTNTGRYATTRNLILKSTQAALATSKSITTDLTVYPNSAQALLTVPHAPAPVGAQVLVYSATGARALAQPAQPGTTDTTVALDKLAPGLYLVEYADGSTRRTTRFVKE